MIDDNKLMFLKLSGGEIIFTTLFWKQSPWRVIIMEMRIFGDYRKRVMTLEYSKQILSERNNVLQENFHRFELQNTPKESF